MLTKILAALVAAVGIGVTGVYFASSPDGGCPLSGGSSDCAICPLSASTCDSAATCSAATEDSGCCEKAFAGAQSEASAQTLATAAAVSCAVCAESCPAAASIEKK